MEDAPYTRGLAEYIAGSRFEDLPKPLVEHVKLLVLDTIGVGVFGASLPWSERLRATAEAMEAPGRVSVWCSPLAFSAPTAAMINGDRGARFRAGRHRPRRPQRLGHALLGARDRAAPRQAIGRGADQRDRHRHRDRRAREPLRRPGAARRHGIPRPGLFGTFASVASASRALGLERRRRRPRAGTRGPAGGEPHVHAPRRHGKAPARGPGRARGDFRRPPRRQRLYQRAERVRSRIRRVLRGAHGKPAASDLRSRAAHQRPRHHVSHRRSALQDVGVPGAQPRHARSDQGAAEETAVRRGGREGGAHPPRQRLSAERGLARTRRRRSRRRS